MSHNLLQVLRSQTPLGLQFQLQFDKKKVVSEVFRKYGVRVK